MESVLLAVALLGFGIGGYFVVGRVARFFAIGTSGRSAGRGAGSHPGWRGESGLPVQPGDKKEGVL